MRSSSRRCRGRASDVVEASEIRDIAVDAGSRGDGAGLLGRPADICAVAEISRSTFVRYFPSKEDALFAGTADAGEQLRAALAARPSGETPWVAMRHALDPLIEHYDAHDERVRRLARIVFSTPALKARHREKNSRWYALLRPEVARRLGTDPADGSDPRADAVIATALGCVEVALSAWTSSEHAQALPEILDRAMGAIG